MKEIYSTRTDKMYWTSELFTAVDTARECGATKFELEVSEELIEMKPQFADDASGLSFLPRRAKVGEYEHRWRLITLRAELSQEPVKP